ncbi:MAG: signal peptide peptidase SppA [Burkholderiaceae bacterium]|nr:signal peptide peptidase SppA [Burkholderiaceae bacterium]
MSATRPGFFGRWFGRFWRLIDGTRRLLLNLLFLALIAALVWAFATRAPTPLKDKTVLVLNLRGPVVEQYSGSWRDNALGRVRGQPAQQVQLRDILDVLDAAAKDPQITQALLMLDDFQGAGLATLREISVAVQRFKAAGKPVVAWGSRYDQRQYHVASAADELLLHPMGLVHLEGYGRYRNYYRDALDRLGVTVNLIRVGTYKTFGEPFIANGPSPASIEAESLLNNGLWGSYTDAVEHARKLPPGSVMRGIDELPQRMAAAGGDLARLALDAKLVDALKTRDELRQMMIERGARDDDLKSFRQVSFDDYLRRLKPRRDGDAVAVVVAEGEIGDGEAPPGRIGGLSTAALIRKAREDEQVKALVLRVDSPGGSAFGAELIRRELELTRAAGKPVVVSMGDLAASGGYWVATSADEVIADAATITGSIGVFTLLPTAEKTLDQVGVHTGGVTTTWLGAAYDPRRAIDPRFAALVQSSVDHTYADFVAKVAAARKRSPAQIDAVAQGRVWTGAQALERGLVDRLGSYGDALQAAALRGKLPGAERGDYRITFLECEPGRLQQLLDLLGGSVYEGLARRIDALLPAAGLPLQGALDLQKDLLWLAELTQQRRPFALAVHCLCSDP